ncbi:TetR/AcrR family transcriptional regulator [Lysinibacillus endophyticus]|uniref:TetR/AcrR family transcriptional regulator n=1 Tax=Ureibacillus endophyticus TaxID=1978490 RepID=A0A494Z5H6_9BACL|nr:TetR/AcrR family transcriptional regulator [Lysinibacillus endophyticus]MCP1143590.1 TetR/AcrR family transcriptional regulator [Lysinibacillus endophyticus]RKQ17799.1 TetR/AcrR family transcriptional regulator [Lysinibacillus endophyticus]
MLENEEKILVQTNVKDENLIEIRRKQIVSGAVKLFREKGFHRATTREIAKAAGFSIGTLYEYIRTKEDVLYLVCDNIYDQVIQRLSTISTSKGTLEELKLAIKQYFSLIDSMVDEFTIMYQETKSLPKDKQQYILQKELEMVSLFEKIIKNCVQSGELTISNQEIYLAANLLVVQGQAWAFRKWALQKHFTIEEYTEAQITMCLSGLLHYE